MIFAVSLIVILAFYAGIFMLSTWMSKKFPMWINWLFWALLSSAFFVFDIVRHDESSAAFQALIGSFYWYMFWRSKPPRMRDKAKKLIGAKAKALKEKLVAAMPKASPVGSPVLLPVGA